MCDSTLWHSTIKGLKIVVKLHWLVWLLVTFIKKHKHSQAKEEEKILNKIQAKHIYVKENDLLLLDSWIILEFQKHFGSSCILFFFPIFFVCLLFVYCRIRYCVPSNIEMANRFWIFDGFALIYWSEMCTLCVQAVRQSCIWHQNLIDSRSRMQHSHRRSDFLP